MLNRLIIVAAISTLALGCGKKKSSKSATKPSGMAEAKVDGSLCDTEKQRVQTFDMNRDNRADVWKLYRTEEENGAAIQLLSCKQIDFNYDGKKDLVTGYGRLGNKEFEKVDLDWDGRFDAYYIFNEKGRKIEVHRDSDFDGNYDSKEIWNEKGLKSIRRDRNADKEPDVWEQYVGGKLVAILYDEDFDGRVDRREDAADSEQIKEQEKKSASGDTEKELEEGQVEAPKEEAPAEGKEGPE